MGSEVSLKKLLSDNGIDLKKSLGQNFLADSSVPVKIAESACGLSEGVIEIGPGAGALTKELCKRFKKVVAIELDGRMRPVLETVLSEFDNYELVFNDVLKTDLKKIIEDMDVKTVSVVANLPYYITTPIIMKLLESKLPFTAITVMVQKEVAERLCAKLPGKNAGAVTVSVNFYSEPSLLFNVSRGCFLPPPKVDSAVIRLNLSGTNRINIKSEKSFKKLVTAAFTHRRKTFVNSVSQYTGIEKPLLFAALQKRGLSENVRAEELSLEDFGFLSDILFDGGRL